MSTRHLRRLQQLVQSSTAADEAGYDETTAPTATMKPTRRRKKHPKDNRPLLLEQTDNVSQVMAADDDEHAIGHSSEDSEPSASTTKNQSTRSAHSDVPASANPSHPTFSEQARLEKERRKRAEQKQRSKQKSKRKKAEEDALLEVVLQERCKGATAQDTSGADQSMGGGASDLLSALTLCDSTKLNSRLERIKMFGASAVEDVGDGLTPHRGADGEIQGTASTSLFPLHNLVLRFRNTPLATPNRYRWVPFDSLGVCLRVVTASDEDLSSPSVPRKEFSHAQQAPVVYALSCDSNAFRQAEAARMRCMERVGGVQDLVDCLSSYGVYHLPTLLQLSTVFDMMGDTLRSQELVELALYVVGMLLTHIPLRATWQKRVLPYRYPSNQLIFQTLRRGVHTALRRGCARTAWEMSKLLCSLDSSDPCGMLLIMDYLALRARRWVWVLEVYTMIVSLTRENKEERAGGSDDHNDLAKRLLCLPGFSFSAALAKYYLEYEAAHSNDEGSHPSKVLREITTEQQSMLLESRSSTELLATAILQFPVAAVLLTDSLQGIDTVCKDAMDCVDARWDDVKTAAECVTSNRDDPHCRAQVHLAELFVARNNDMWKPMKSIQFLRSVIAGDNQPLSSCSYTHPPYQGGADGLQSTASSRPEVAAYGYSHIQVVDVTGNVAAVIPTPLPEAEEEVWEDIY